LNGFPGAARKPLKRFREFSSTLVTYLKIGVNKKRRGQPELTLHPNDTAN